MDLSPQASAVILAILIILALVAAFWFFAAVGGWINEAFEEQRWGWFLVLCVISFPGGPIAALIIYVIRHTER